MLRHPVLFKRALARAAADDAMNISQSAAYSAIFALFPTLIVVAAVIPLLPDSGPMRAELSAFFARLLPSDVTPMLEGYFAVSRPSTLNSTRAILVAVLVSLSGASSVIATFMEGVRRAYDLPPDCWTFLQRRLRALLLVPLSLVPLACSSVLVIFGHFLALWLAGHAAPSLQTPLYLLALLIRWSVTLTGSVGLIALLYKLGTPLRQRWRDVLPGAAVATGLWLASTLVFGWYVTRFANYSRVYGSLGAGIALLVWLFLTSLSVLCGAEFNGQLASARQAEQAAGEAAVCLPEKARTIV